MEANEVIMLISTIAVYKAIRFISSSLHIFHPVAVDRYNDDVVSTSTVSSSSHDISVPPPATKYDVFLSFRGEDIRDNFTSHLYEALCKANLETFIDHKLHKGEQISPILLRTIEESEISVIIFSKDYASSMWCLDELVKIMECQDRYGRVVIPIFYNVDPSNVRKQSGSFGDAFSKLKKRFKHDKEKVQMWKNAMTQSTNISGWDSKNIKPDSELIKKIVKDIWDKLNHLSSCHFDGLIGIGRRIEKIAELLYENRIVGVWGMGGIGKTTHAKVVFHKLKAQFESFSFVENVREKLVKIGLDNLLEECLKELLKEDDNDVYHMKFTSMKFRLQHKKILLVLDDVDNFIIVEDLTKVCDWFGEGSRIIITSRDKQVLKNASASTLYHVRELNFSEALHLFSLKAFKQKVPHESYMELSKWILGHCEGNPLALRVLGSFLHGRGKEEWESTLEKLKQYPQKDIFNVLKLSFDGLDDQQRNIFLDLAFLVKETYCLSLDFIRNFYESSAYIEISVLNDKCLISIDEIGDIKMHDLVMKMGLEISRQQLILHPQRPVRLWRHEDIYQVFNNKEGMETIQFISLDMCKTQKIILTTSTFQKMCSLKYLKFYTSGGPSNVYISEGLDKLPKNLRILDWEEYPLPHVPLAFCAGNLVELYMPDSHLRQLWDGNQHFPNLHLIDLGDSKHLIELPNLSQTPNIQEINLCRCVNLAQIHSSIGLPKLCDILTLGCTKLRHVEIGGKIKRRSSGIVVVRQFLDLENFAFNKVTVKAFASNDDNILRSFQIKVMSVAFREILECMDSIGSVKFKLLTQNLASLLPFVSIFGWLDTPFEFGNFEKNFHWSSFHGERSTRPSILTNTGLDVTKRNASDAIWQEINASTTSSKLEVTDYMSDHKVVREVKEMVVETRTWENREKRMPLELEEELITEAECCGNSDNTITRAPYIITRWSLLTEVMLQENEVIGRATWSILDLSVLKSLAEIARTRLQPAIDFTFSRDIAETKGGNGQSFIGYRQEYLKMFIFLWQWRYFAFDIEFSAYKIRKWW